MSFTPQFDDSVYEYGPYGKQHLTPRLYATQLSAMQRADQLADLKPKVVMQFPWQVAPASPFYFTSKVPFLLFPSGYCENAGAIQMWWVRCPEPEGLALRYCKQQIAADEAAWMDDQRASNQQ